MLPSGPHAVSCTALTESLPCKSVCLCLCPGSTSLPLYESCGHRIVGFYPLDSPFLLWLLSLISGISGRYLFHLFLSILGSAKWGRCHTPTRVSWCPAVLHAVRTCNHQGLRSLIRQGSASSSSKAAAHRSCRTLVSCLWPASCITTLAPSLPLSSQRRMIHTASLWRSMYNTSSHVACCASAHLSGRSCRDDIDAALDLDKCLTAPPPQGARVHRPQ